MKNWPLAGTAIVLLIAAGLFFLSGAEAAYQVYVPNAGDGTISVIDVDSEEVTATIAVGESTSHGLAVTPDNRYIYTGNLDDGQVFVVSTATREVVNTIEVGERVHGIDIRPDGRFVLVSAGRSGGPYLAVIDTETREVVAEISESLVEPTHIDFSPDGRHAFVADPGANAVIVVRTGDWTVDKVVATGAGAQETELSPDAKLLYVANYAAGTLSVVDAVKLEEIREVEVGQRPHAIAVSPDGRQVWVTNHGSGDVYVLDRIKDFAVTARIELGSMPNHVTFHPDGDRVLITDLQEGRLRVVDAVSLEVLNEITVGASPHEVDFRQVR